VATRFLAPAVIEVSEQEPAPPASAPMQVFVPSLTVTFPVGVPPGEVTLNDTV